MRTTNDRPGSILNPQTLEAISTLAVRVRRVVEGLQGGAHASPHMGASVEYADHKKYCPGDDIRHMDWRALARTDRYFVKQFQREVVLRCLMVLDCSASMGYRGTKGLYNKLEYAVVLLAAMAHILVRQGDAAGLLTFADRTLDLVPPGRRPDHLPALMARLAKVRPSPAMGTAFSEAITSAAEGAGRRAMVVLASDLWGAGRDAELALAHLAARGHDVVLFHILDPDEIDLPFDKPSVFRGLEGEPEIGIDPAFIRNDYQKEVEAMRDHWRLLCGESGIHLQLVTTSSLPEKVLAALAAQRHQGARRG